MDRSMTISTHGDSMDVIHEVIVYDVLDDLDLLIRGEVRNLAAGNNLVQNRGESFTVMMHAEVASDRSVTSLALETVAFHDGTGPMLI